MLSPVPGTGEVLGKCGFLWWRLFLAENKGKAQAELLRFKSWLWGRLSGSVVEGLPLAQVPILGSSPTSGSPQGACFSLCLCVSHE